MWTFGQIAARGEAPVALGIDHRRANFVAINEHVHGRTHFARAAEGRTRVVGAVTRRERPGDRTDIINHAGHHRHAGGCGINGKSEDR